MRKVCVVLPQSLYICLTYLHTEGGKTKMTSKERRFLLTGKRLAEQGKIGVELLLQSIDTVCDKDFKVR